MNDTIEFLTNLRRIQYVERLAGSYKLRSYDNARHQYFVGVMFIRLAKEENIPITVDILEKVLCHDLVELYTGDLLNTAKNITPTAKKLWNEFESEIVNGIPSLFGYDDQSIHGSMTEDQFLLFKACDLLELWCFCREEQILGNSSSHNQKVVKNCEFLLFKAIERFPSIGEFMTGFEERI